MKWLMAIPVWSTPRDSLNRFNLVFSRCPYEESPFRVLFLYFPFWRINYIPLMMSTISAPMRFWASTVAAPMCGVQETIGWEYSAALEAGSSA